MVQGVEKGRFSLRKGISHKQGARWHHLTQLKASALFPLQKNICSETQQLILVIGNAI